MSQLIENPNIAQRELLAGRALVRLPAVSVFTVSGDDRFEWLNSMLSQKITGLQVGQSIEALHLDVQGHIIRVFHIFCDSTKVWCITHSDGFAEYFAFLSRMIFRSKVQLADESSNFVAVAGFAAAAGTFGLGELIWSDSWPVTAPGGFRYGAAPTEQFDYFEALLPEVGSGQILADAPLASVAALDALRVAAWRPAAPNEIDERALPHEFDWLATAVHLSKGCYRGQETVAKVHNLGHPPRRLVFLHMDGSGHVNANVGDLVFQLDAAGQPIGEPVGRVTSVGSHFEMGPIALALVKRNVPIDAPLEVHAAKVAEADAEFGAEFEAGAELEAGAQLGISATQQVIVPPTAGAEADIKNKLAGNFRIGLN